MATHSSILVQRIPWIEEPGGLQFMGLQSLQLTLSFSPFPEPQHTLYISPSHVTKDILLFCLTNTQLLPGTVLSTL